MRPSKALMPGRPSAFAVIARATRAGAKVPRSNKTSRARAGAGAVPGPCEIRTAVMKQAQVTAYVRTKNLTRGTTGSPPEVDYAGWPSVVSSRLAPARHRFFFPFIIKDFNPWQGNPILEGNAGFAARLFR